MPDVERKLAAILAADVVGYSRLTGTDEEGTLGRLRELRDQVIHPAVQAQRGRIVKEMGDGIIIEFLSAVDAARAALDIQRQLGGRNAGLVVDNRLELRMGIHIGDVVVQPDGDVLGETVNIAARLEGIAQPGGICLSEDAYRQIRNRLPAHPIAWSMRAPPACRRQARRAAIKGAKPPVASARGENVVSPQF
jgi:adenylate cyclase